jgi:chromosome segregation ATPase
MNLENSHLLFGACAIAIASTGIAVWLYLAMPDVAVDQARIVAYESQIAELQSKIDSNAEQVLELQSRSNAADARAKVAAKHAADWRAKFDRLDAERKAQPKLNSTKDAIDEMKHQGWIR